MIWSELKTRLPAPRCGLEDLRSRAVPARGSRPADLQLSLPHPPPLTGGKPPVYRQEPGESKRGESGVTGEGGGGGGEGGGEKGGGRPEE